MMQIAIEIWDPRKHLEIGKREISPNTMLSNLIFSVRANPGQIYIFICNFYFIQNENRFNRSLRGNVYFYNLDYLHY